jgi:acetyl esterase/lipase
VIAELQKGWDVVSINYRLATEAPGPGIRAPELLADVDRAVRYTRQNAATLGLDLSTFVVAGGSAGGHLALMHAQGAPTNEFMDPALPADLAAVPATVDGVVGLVAPTDLNTMWMAGGIAPGGQESLLGCTLADVPTIPGMGPCDQQVVDRYSPLFWSQTYLDEQRTLPPAYFAYGGEDTLVQMPTQGTPNITLWTASAAPNTTWVDYPATGTHNIDDQMNYLAFDAWLDRVASRNWAAPTTTNLTVPTTTAP